MKTTHFLTIVLATIVVSLISSCSKNSEKLTLKGQIEGIKDGTLILQGYGEEKILADTIKITNGEFAFEKVLNSPTLYYAMIPGTNSYLNFYAENCEMTLNAKIDSLSNAIITGSKVNDDNKIVLAKQKEINQKYKTNELSLELSNNQKDKPLTKERQDEINSIFAQCEAELTQVKIDFIKNNPKSYLSVFFIKEISYGMSASKIDEYVSLLDKSILELSPVKKIKENLEKMKKSEVTLDGFIKEANNITYKLDPSYNGLKHTNMVYLAAMSNNNICGLKENGSVVIISPKGDLVKEYKSVIKSSAGAIAVDKSDNIYVLGTKMEKVTKTIRGKSREVLSPNGVECIVLNNKGLVEKEINLDSLKTVTGAKISESNLIVSDSRGQQIIIFDLSTGKLKATINKLRTCCGILDFGVRNDNEILVANLGAFRIDSFDYSGKSMISFGQRGTSINDFHGCCNPVSVAFLSNGAIVSVEKEPTRIKIYSKDGAKKVEGIEELVKGCSFIPMAIDSNNCIYLASDKSGIVKCISNK